MASYDVLMSTGKIQQCLIAPVYGEDGLVFVMDLDSEKVGITATGVIFTTRQYTETDFREALDRVSSDAASVRPDDKVVFMGYEACATQPITIAAKTAEDDVTTVKKGWSCLYDLKSIPDGFMHNRRGEVFDPRPLGYIGENDCKELVISPGGNRHIKMTRGRAFLNSNHYRAIVFGRCSREPGAYSPADEYEDKLCCSDFGDHNTIVEVLEKVASPVKVWTTDSEIVVKDDTGSRGMGKAAALGYLMRKHGCAETDARTMIKTAMRRPRRWLVKAAADNLMGSVPRPQRHRRGWCHVELPYHPAPLRH